MISDLTIDHDLHTSTFTSVNRKLVNGTVVSGQRIDDALFDNWYSSNNSFSFVISGNSYTEETQYQSSKLTKTLDPQTAVFSLLDWETDCYGEGTMIYEGEVPSDQWRLKYEESYNYTGEYDAINNHFDIDNNVNLTILEHEGYTSYYTTPTEYSKLTHAIGFDPGTTSITPLTPSGGVPNAQLVGVTIGSNGGMSFGTIDFGDLETSIPEINNVYPPPPPLPPLSDFTVEQSLLGKVLGTAWNYRHEILDVAGMVPVIGEAFDVANAALYLTEGDYVNAGMSMASTLPAFGNAVTAGKWGKKGAGLASGLGKNVVNMYQFHEERLQKSILISDRSWHQESLGKKENELDLSVHESGGFGGWSWRFCPAVG
jgi:hypothetical protein